MDDTLVLHSSTNAKTSDYKIPKSPQTVIHKSVLDSDDVIEGVDNNKSVNTMKKIYSIDRIAFNILSTNREFLGSTNYERSPKNSKIMRSSSTNLGKDHAENVPKPSGKSLYIEPTFRKSGHDVFVLDILGMKKYALAAYIEDNPKSADFKWSLFCAACHSYRFDSVLRPFPPMFLQGDTKDIDRLRDVAESCPSINVLYEEIQDRGTHLSTDLINLLYWVLIHMREPRLKFIPKEKHCGILSKALTNHYVAAPHFIFQITYGENSLEQQKFAELAKDYKTIYAFHGNRLDNFYSVLNYGLRISFSKISSLGLGVQLFSEMNVSLPYSQTGFSWGGSYFGSQISIVALCELIDHPDVRTSDEKMFKKKRNFMVDLESAPEKYFIVQNSDLVRVKYLLVYCNEFPELSTTNQLSKVMSWFQRNKVIAVVMAYVFLLMAIATSNNSTLYKFYKRIARRIGLRVVRV